MRVVGEGDTAKLNIENLNKIIIEDLKDRVLVSSYFEYERLQQSYLYLDPTTSSIVVHPSSLCSYLTGKYRDLRIDSLSEFISVLRHLGFKSRSYKVDGNHINLMSCRSRFLFKNESDWEKYLLDVSKGTMWEENFRAFLLGEDVEQEDIPSEIKEEIMDSATVFLDTEKNIR
jgi:hypothetical protein